MAEAEDFEPFRKLKRGAQAVADFVGTRSTKSKLSPHARPASTSPAPSIGARDVVDVMRGKEGEVRSRAERAQLKSDKAFTEKHGPMAPMEKEKGLRKQFRKARPVTRKLGR